MRGFIYKNKKYIVKLCDYNFKYYITKYRGYTVIYFNKTLDSKEKSRILHKLIRNSMIYF